MNILYISQYFPPEIGATQSRAYEMAKNLIKLGHHVTVLTEIPNHPSGIVPEVYRHKLRVAEQHSNIPVIRCWVYATPVKTLKTRLFFYLSFLFSAIINSLFIKRKFDVVFATSPPLFAGLTGVVISKLRRIPFVFEVRDLWPESAIELNQIRKQIPIRAGHTIANLCYRHSQKIICVTKGINAKLRMKGIAPEKLHIIKNGTNPERFKYYFDGNLQIELGWKDKFVVLYAGIHGIAQGLLDVLRAAEILKNKKEIQFSFIGEGPNKKNLISYAKKRNLTNVEFLPEVSSDKIAQYISLANICLVPLKKKALFRGALPSKIFDSWACEKPIVLSVDGEAREEVEKAKAGIYIEPENFHDLANAIEYFCKNPNIAIEMGHNGRQYVLDQGYIRSKQASDLAQILSSVSIKSIVKERFFFGKKSILHIITRLIVGGAQENTLLTADRINRKKFWDVEVLTGPQTGPEGSLVEYALENSIPLKIEKTLVREIHPVKDMCSFIKLFQHIKKGRYTVVHTHSSKAGILGRWAAWLAQTPIIIHTVHGWSFHNYQHKLIQDVFKLIERITLKITDKLIVVTNQDIVKGKNAGIDGNGTYELIRSGIELEIFKNPTITKNQMKEELGIPLDAIVVGTVTRLSPQKAPLVFIEAAKRVSQKYRNVYFIIVGDGPLRTDAEQLVASLGLHDRFYFTGIRRDVTNLMNSFDIFALSSLWEGLPRVIPQAMASGLPVIASAIDGNQEIVKDYRNGRLFPPGNHIKLADTILELIADPKQAFRLGRKGMEDIDEYDVNRMVQQICDLYDNQFSVKISSQ